MIRLNREMFKLLVLPLVFAIGIQSDSINSYENFSKLILNTIISDTDKPQEQIQNKYAIKLLKQTIKQLGSTYMFITDNESHENLLRNFQINFLHSYFTEPKYLAYSKSNWLYNLLIFDKKFNLKEVIAKKKPSQNTKFFLHVKNYEDAIGKFEILWQNRLVNVLATYVENSTIYYYTYFPYCSKHCGKVGTPYLLAKYNISSGVFSRKKKLYPSKIYDLHKCPVKITLTQNVPSSYYTVEKKLTGWEVDLLNEILKRMNGVPDYRMLNLKKRVYGTAIGYSRLVEKSDIGAGLAISLKSIVKTDFCMYGMSLCATWIVPKKEDSPYSSNFLTKVFPSDIWLLLLLTYFAMAIVIRAFYKMKYSNILFKLLPFLLGITTQTKRISRRLGMLWLWFCVIMNAIYQSGFHGTLLVPDFPQQLSTTKDIMESKLKILGVSDIITDAFPYFKKNYNLSSKRFRNRKFSYEDWVYRMTVKKDSAYLGFKEIVSYHTESTGLARKIYILEPCIIKYLVAFVLKRNSHLTDVVVKYANRLNENGFLIFFIRKHFFRKSIHESPAIVKKIIKSLQDDEYNELPLPIDMNKIFVVFLGLLGGLLLGLISFIWESLSQKNWKKFKKVILRELQYAWSYRN